MLDKLVDDLKAAASGDDAASAVNSILADFVSDPVKAKAALPGYAEDDVVIFEDDSVSTWFCRFNPGMTVPPHDHKMPAMIGVIQGVERNDLYERDDRGVPVLKSGTPVAAGNVVRIAADAIHGVTCTSEEPSEAIHVYLGALTRTERSLFDTDAGEELPYTDDNYRRLMGN